MNYKQVINIIYYYRDKFINKYVDTVLIISNYKLQ